jgi:hypothetical protein
MASSWRVPLLAGNFPCENFPAGDFPQISQLNIPCAEVSYPVISTSRNTEHVGLHEKCTLILSDFNQNWNGSASFSKIPQYQFTWKSVWPFLSFYMHTDRWTG